MEEIKTGEVYQGLVQLVIHAATISWTRFYNFLMFNSILLLSWTTLFAASGSRRSFQTSVMAALCVLGGLSGVAWAGLSARSEKFLREYIKIGAEVEGMQGFWSDNLKDHKLMTRTSALGHEMAYGWATSARIQLVGAVMFTVLYVFLLVVSILR